MIVKLLTEHHLEFLSLKGGCRGLSESTLVKYHIVGNHVSWLNYVGASLSFFLSFYVSKSFLMGNMFCPPRVFQF